MLDVTGSMAGQKLNDLKDCRQATLSISSSGPTEQVRLKVALVPFSEDIRLPYDRRLDHGARHRPGDLQTS